MRRQRRHHQVALAQRLTDELEVHLLEVAQAAVEEPARPRRGAAGEVACLDQRRRQPAGDGVERDAGSGDTAADDEYVDPPAVQALPGALMGLRAELRRSSHRPRLSTKQGPVGDADRAPHSYGSTQDLKPMAV